MLGDERLDAYTGLELGRPHRRSVSEVLQARPRRRAVPGLAATSAASRRRRGADTWPALVNALLTLRTGGFLTARRRRAPPPTAALLAGGPADPDDINRPAPGSPRSARSTTSRSSPCRTRSGCADAEQKTAVDNLIGHCEQAALPDRDRRPAAGPLDLRGARVPVAVRHASTPRSTTPGSRSSTRPRGPTPARRRAMLRAAAVRLRRRHLRAQRHRARRAQGAGERGGARHHRVHQNVTFDRQSVLNPEGINALRFFEGRAQPGLGRPDDELGPGVEVRQRPPAVHLPRALDRQEHPVGGVRAEQRAAVGQHPADRSRTSCSPSGGPAR